MATRTQFPTGPHKDGKQPHDRGGRGSAMSEESFRSTLEMLAVAPYEAQIQVRHATFTALRRLGQSRDRSLAVKPDRHSGKSVDVRSVIEWTERIGPRHRRSIGQLKVIDATCVALTS